MANTGAGASVGKAICRDGRTFAGALVVQQAHGNFGEKKAVGGLDPMFSFSRPFARGQG
jgi:hypothetical protein